MALRTLLGHSPLPFIPWETDENSISEYTGPTISRAVLYVAQPRLINWATIAETSSRAMKDRNADSKYQQLTVALRIRPMNETEMDEEASSIVHKVGEQMVVLMDPTEAPDDILRANRSREKTFIFDVVFDKQATQEDVYASTTKNLVEGVISGYNATVFAYGPTGTGKTYTMLGMDCEPGIYIRTLNDLFKAIEETSDSMDYSVSMSYLEIYNELIRDLLNPSSGVLELREDSKGSIQIPGITEFSTTNAKEIMQLLRKGNKQRTQEPTAANKTSSRSHAVLQVTVKQKNRVKDVSEELRVGRLFMIDLAGSERASQTKNRGKRMKEGAHINRSLLALGNCITALSEKGANRPHHVNFRDSKLTRLLKDSLGGNSRTVMIAHISPASTSFEESRTTLIYAYRAKNIKTRVKRNLQNVSYHIAQYTSIITDLRKEIERLEEKVKQQEKEKRAERDEIYNGQEGVHLNASSSSHQEMNNLRDQLISAFKEQMEMRRSLMQLENTNIELHIDTSRHLITITDWEQDRVRRGTKPRQKSRRDKATEDMLIDTGDEEDEEEEEDTPEPHEVAVAREEINMLLAEQRKTATLKAELEKRLADTKLKASQLEQLLPKQTSTEDQQEVLRLLCRVHELEVGNTELQAKALCKENLLCQKDFVIQRYQQHKHLCEEIIQQQQALIEGNKIPVPDILERLLQVYSQELEKGTLNRLYQLQLVISSTLRNGLVQNGNCQLKFGESLLHLDLEHLEKVVSDSRKGVHSRARFELPPIIFESDSDSKTSKSTPAFIQTRQNSSLSPTVFHYLRTPTQQEQELHLLDVVRCLKYYVHHMQPFRKSDLPFVIPKSSFVGQAASKVTVASSIKRPDDTSVKENLPSFLSPNSVESDRRHSISVPQLSPEVLEEIAVETKSISLVAARRRSRVLGSESPFFMEKGDSFTSQEFLEKDGARPKDVQPIFVHRPHMKKAISIERIPADPQKKMLIPLQSKQALQIETFLERKSKNKRSHSFQDIPAEFPSEEPQNLHSHRLESISQPKPTPAAINSKTFLRVNASRSNHNSIPTATVLKLHSSPQAEGPLQILKVSRTPPSTVIQSNASDKRGLMLRKRVKGPGGVRRSQAIPAFPKNVKTHSQAAKTGQWNKKVSITAAPLEQNVSD